MTMTNLRISGPQAFPCSESDIRVDFRNPQRVIAAANAIAGGSTGQAQFFTSDGGTTWQQTFLPLAPGDSIQSDPTVDWTSDGTAWSVTIGIDSTQKRLRLQSYKSVDGGANWDYAGEAAAGQTSADKQMMWVDHSANSQFRDNIHLIWHDNAPVFVNHRTGPNGTWQAPIQVSGAETTGTGIGADIKTNSQGDVFAFWPDTGSQNIYTVKSTDGGATYSAPIAIAATFAAFQVNLPAFAGREALVYATAGAFRNAAKDLVYAAWMDLAGTPGCTGNANDPGTDVQSSCKSRIWFTRSTDGGATWQPKMMVNNQPSKNDQFNPKLAVDETSGQLVLIYYDTVADPNRVRTDVWMQTSGDDGVTWSAASRVTTAETDETSPGADAGNQYGDYNGLSGVAGVFFPSWTDRRSGAHEEIWTAALQTNGHRPAS